MKIKLYLITLITFLAIDSLWLGGIAPSFYRSQIGHLMADEPNFIAAAFFYLIFIFGMVYFVVEPCMRGGRSPKQTALRGAIFGFVTYATYDLTNHATLVNWPVLMTIVDMTWGTVLSSLVALVSVWAGRRLIK